MKRIIVCVLACLLLACAAGCAAEQGAGQVLSAIVDGDGQKPWMLLLDYGEELAAEAVSE